MWKTGNKSNSRKMYSDEKKVRFSEDFICRNIYQH